MDYVVRFVYINRFTFINLIIILFIVAFINFSVAMFLFLSGYLTKAENDNWCAFYKKRIIRVIIPYVIWTVVYSIQNLLLHGGDVKTIIFNLFTTKATGHLYYLFVYIQFVLLTPLLAKLIKSRLRWLGWFISPLSVIVFKYYFLLSGQVVNETVSIVWDISCLAWFTFYYLGLMLGNKIKICKFNYKNLIIFYILSILIQMGEGYVWLSLGEFNCGTQLKISALLTSSIFILLAYWFINSNSIKIKGKALFLIGDCSFGIYLSHIMFKNVLSHIPYYSSIPTICQYILDSFFVLIISLLFVVVGKKLLGKRLSKWVGLI